MKLKIHHLGYYIIIEKKKSYVSTFSFKKKNMAEAEYENKSTRFRINGS